MSGTGVSALKSRPAPFFRVELIQSVLFPSPYSGCRRFSGWPKEVCHQAPGTVWPAQNRLQPLLCVDRYHKSAQARPAPLPPKYGPPRATLTVMTPTQQGRFVVSGPSATGPYTRFSGWDWKGGDEWEVGTAGAGGHNLGLA